MKTTLDAELKTKWVAALRSGEYKQARWVLYTPAVEGYCCLGVLGKVMGYSNEEMHEYGRLSTCMWKNRQKVFTPFGLAEEGKLSHLNDAEGKTFNEIADYVEENL